MAVRQCFSHFLKAANVLVLVAVVLIVVHDQKQQFDTSVTEDDPSGEIGHRMRKRSVEGGGGGAIYTRWGRTTCGNDNVKLIYAGVVGGSRYSHSGGGSNYLCMHKETEWGNVKAGNQYSTDGRALLYGTEYKGKAESIYSMANIESNNAENNDVPCAVCMAWSRSSTVMIPGRLHCPDDWTTEYKGYLVAERYTFKGRTMHVCLDEAPEAVEGGSADLDGALMYPVEAACGSLPCPSYQAGHEISCVVCTY